MRINPATDPTSILEHLDDLYRGVSSYAVLTMEVKTAHYTRKLRMEAWTKGKDLSLVRIVKPLKEKGIATLKVRENIYNYLPKIKRTVKISSSMMMNSWMGSHFTNDDLVKESRMSEDYIATTTFEGKRDGSEIYEFSLLPREDAVVVWGKIIVRIRKKDLMPLRMDYFDEEMNPVRYFVFDDFQKTAGRLLPLSMKVVPLDKKDEYTLIKYHELKFDIPLKDSFFSLKNLTR